MALGKRRDKQQELLIPTTELPRSPGHPFYRSLSKLLAAAGNTRPEESAADNVLDPTKPGSPVAIP